MLIEKCIICSERKFKFLFKGKDRLYHLPGEFNLYQCRNCGLVVTYPQLTADDFAHYYPQNYYSYEDSRRVTPLKSFAEKVRYYLLHPIQALNCILYSKILAQNRDLPAGPGMRILDVGCGDGRYLIEKKSLGCTCFGNDINASALDRLRLAAPEIETQCGNLWDVGYSEGFFDRINLSQVVEHVAEVDKLLSEAGRILKKDGRIRVQVPNFAALTARIFGKHWIHLDVPRHAYVFSICNLKILFKKMGLEVVSCRMLENSFSMIGSSFYVFNQLFGQKIEIMRHERIWNNEVLKCFLFPYALLVNLFRIGDNVEFILKKTVTQNF